MPEQVNPRSESYSVFHFVVVGEGARDNEWMDSEPSSLHSSDPSSQHKFMLLPIPPSPTNAIVPIVRVFGSNPLTAPSTASLATSNPSRNPTTPSPQLTTTTPTAQNLYPAATRLSTAPTSHGNGSFLPLGQLSSRGSRMIAHPAMNQAHPAMNQAPPVDTSVPQIASQQTSMNRRAAGEIHASHGRSNKEQDLARAAEEPLENVTTVKRALRRPLSQSMSASLASEAQSAALKNVLRNQKNLYQHNKTLPPLLSEPAAQAALAARMQASRQADTSKLVGSGGSIQAKKTPPNTSATSPRRSHTNLLTPATPTNAPVDEITPLTETVTQLPLKPALNPSTSLNTRARHERGSPPVAKAMNSSKDNVTRPDEVDRTPAPEREDALSAIQFKPARTIAVEKQIAPRVTRDSIRSNKESLQSRQPKDGMPNLQPEASVNSSGVEGRPDNLESKLRPNDFAITGSSSRTKDRGLRQQNKSLQTSSDTSMTESHQKIIEIARQHKVPNKLLLQHSRSRNCNDLMTEPFEYCIKLMVQSLCLCGSGQAINKKAASKCRQELRAILDPENGARGTRPDEGSRKENKLAQSPKITPTNTNELKSTHEGINSPRNSTRHKTSGSAVASSTSIGSKQREKLMLSHNLGIESTPRASQVGSSGPGGPAVGSKNNSESRNVVVSKTPISSAVNGIRFTFIQWQLAVQQERAEIEDIAREAREIVDTCRDLMSPGPDTPLVSDEEIIAHFQNLNLASVPTLFILEQIAILCQSLAPQHGPKPKALKKLIHALNAFQDILIWTRYVSDKVTELCMKYDSESLENEKVKQIMEGVEVFMDYFLSGEKEGIMSALRAAKKYLAMQGTSDEDDGRCRGRQKSLREEAGRIMLTCLRVCRWLRARSNAQGVERTKQSTIPTTEATTIERPKHVASVQNDPSEDVKNVLKADARVKAKDGGKVARENAPSYGIEPRDKSGAPRRFTERDSAVAIKRKSVDISETKKRKLVIDSTSKNGSTSAKAKTNKQTDIGSELLQSKASTVTKLKGKEGFDAMALMKSISDAQNSSRREGIRSTSVQDKNAGTGTNALASASEALKPEDASKGRAENMVNEQDPNIRARKRRRGNAKVSFATDLVVGSRASKVRKEDTQSLFHHGHDLLGRENPIQEEAVLERMNHLKRGSVIALLGFLRSELLRMKSECEGRQTTRPELVSLAYPPSAAKTITWQAQKETHK